MNRLHPSLLLGALLAPLPALLAQAPAVQAPAPALPAPTAKVALAPRLSPGKDGAFLRAGCIDLAIKLPQPPAPGSLEALADLEAVHMVQVYRTRELVDWAQFIENDNVFKNDRELGPWFNAANLPFLQAFFKKVSKDVHEVSEDAKRRHLRPRPPQADAGIKPCVELPTNTSYPSGHSLQQFVSAGVLAEILPEKREVLFERAHRAAWARIIGGVHFPTDDVGGRILAAVIVEEMKKSPDFQEGVRRCRAEVEPYLKGKAAGK